MPRKGKPNNPLLNGFARVARPEESGANETTLRLLRKSHGSPVYSGEESGGGDRPKTIRRAPTGKIRGKPYF